MLNNHKTEPIFRRDITKLPPLVCINNDEDRVLPNPVLTHATPYWFTFNTINNLNSVTIPANSTVQRNMINDKTALMDLRSLMGEATSAQYLVRIYDNEFSRDMMNRPVHANTIVGNNLRPFSMVEPGFLLFRTQSLQFFLV